MFIHFLCLCTLGLTIKLNFNMSKVAYSVFRWLVASFRWFRFGRFACFGSFVSVVTVLRWFRFVVSGFSTCQFSSPRSAAFWDAIHLLSMVAFSGHYFHFWADAQLFLTVFHLFLKHGGQISVEVTGKRRNKGIGLKSPHILKIFIFSSDPTFHAIFRFG